MPANTPFSPSATVCDSHSAYIRPSRYNEAGKVNGAFVESGILTDDGLWVFKCTLWYKNYALYMEYLRVYAFLTNTYSWRLQSGLWY